MHIYLLIVRYMISYTSSTLAYIASVLWTGIPEANNGVAKSDGGDVRGTWLQLMCCALPKHLCP